MNNLTYPATCLHPLIARQAMRTPGALAIMADEQVLSYHQLQQRSNLLAKQLQTFGIGTENRVGIALPRNRHLAIALLATLKTGAAFVILDLQQPGARLQAIIREAQLTWLLTEETLLSNLPTHLPRFCLDSQRLVGIAPTTKKKLASPTPDQLACIAYFQSTGPLQSVKLLHRNLTQLMYWGRDQFTPESLQCVLFSTPFALDSTAFELFLPLCWGGLVVISEPITAHTILPNTYPLTFLNITPTLLTAWLKQHTLPDSIHTICISSEPDYIGSFEQLYNQYPSIQQIYRSNGMSTDADYSQGFTIPRPQTPDAPAAPCPCQLKDALPALWTQYAQSPAYADVIAVEFDEQRVSYQELYLLTQHLADYLRALQLPTGSIIAICMERSLEQLLCILAIEQIQATCLALDSHGPISQRQEAMAAAQPALLFTQSHLAATCAYPHQKILDHWEEILDWPPPEIFPGATAIKADSNHSMENTLAPAAEPAEQTNSAHNIPNHDIEAQIAAQTYWQQHWISPLPMPLFSEWPRLLNTDLKNVDLKPQNRYFAMTGGLQTCLQQRASEQGVEWPELLLSLLIWVLWRYTGKTEFGLAIPPIFSSSSPELLPLRINITALEPDIHTLLQMLHPLITQARQQHATSPFLIPVDATITTYCQVGFAWHTPLPIAVSPSALTLQLVFEETVERLTGYWQVDAQIINSTTLEHLAGYYQYLLAKIALQPALCFAELCELPAETLQQLQRWEPAPLPWPEIPLIHNLEQQAAATPDKIAVVYAEQSLTYQQLNQRANQLAHYLQHKGVQPGRLIAICLEPLPAFIIALWAVLKTGAAYLPLDSREPLHHLAEILATAHPQWLIAEEWLTDDPALPVELPRLDWSPLQAQLTEWPDINPYPPVVQPDHPLTEPLCLLYPAATDKPRTLTPTAITQTSLLNVLYALQRELTLTATDQALLISPVSAALTQKNLYNLFLVGGTLHGLPSAAALDAKTTAQYLNTHPISLINGQRDVLEALLPYQTLYPWLSLRYIILADASPSSYLGNALPLTVTLISTHGQASCSEVALLQQWPKPWPGNITPLLGRPIANIAIKILDSQQRLLPIGAAGTCWIRLQLSASDSDNHGHPMPGPGNGLVRYGAEGKLLPLLATASITSATLPLLEQENNHPSSTPAAPATPVEEWLIPLWQQLLGLPGLPNRETHFFANGGTLEQAAILCAQIKTTFDVELPLSSLQNAPRLYQLAEQLENEFWSDIPGHDPESWLWGQSSIPLLTPWSLPVDYPITDNAPYSQARLPIPWSEVILDPLQALADRQGVELWMVLCAAWLILLQRYSNNTEITLLLQGQPALPPFIRIDFSSITDFLTLLKQVETTYLHIPPHSPATPHSLTVTLPASFRYWAIHADTRQAIDKIEKTNQLLSLLLHRESEGKLQCEFEYAAAHFRADTIQRYLQHWLQLLTLLGQNPQQPLSSLVLLSADELCLLGAQGWNNTAHLSASPQLLHNLVEQQVHINPNALAIMSAEQLPCCYGDLNRQANQLAHHLQLLGLKTGEAVAVHLTPSPLVGIALFGILKAGGAYLPFADQWPLLRIHQILHQFPVRIVLTDEAHLGAWLSMQWDLPDLYNLICLDSLTPRPAIETWDDAALDRLAAHALLNPNPEGELNILPFIEPWLQADAWVLEVGCGQAHLVFELAPRITHFVAIDPSPAQQQHNQRKALQRGFLHVQWLSGFAHELHELATASFDIALIAGHILRGPLYAEHALDLLLQSIVPGGIIVIMGLKTRQQDPEQGLEPLLFHDYAVSHAKIASFHIEHHPDHYEVCLYTEQQAQESLLRYPRHKQLWTQWHLNRLKTHNPATPLSPSDRALISFISGAQGPVGLEISHRALVNSVQWVNQQFQVSAQDRLLAINPLCSERAIYDLWGPLLAGASLEIATTPLLQQQNPADWLTRLQGSKITIWNSTPTTLHWLIREQPVLPLPALRLLLLSGEPLLPSLPLLLEALCPQGTLVSLQGAPETTLWASYTVLRGHQAGLSGPIHNMQHFILDRERLPCPIGVWGDLYWSGDSLANGYLNAPELTAAHFIPFAIPLLGSPAVTTRYYSSYRARLLANGALEWAERLDQRVTLQGYRLELSEIENVLNQHLAIRDSMVMAYHHGHDLQIVAYCIPQVSLDRIAVNLSGQVTVGDEQRILTVQDLSMTGARLQGIPAHWHVGDTLHLGLALPALDEPLEGKIVWKRLPVAGIQLNPTPQQQAQLAQSLQQLTEQQGFSVANWQPFNKRSATGPRLSGRGVCLLKIDGVLLKGQTEAITADHLIITGINQRWSPQHSLMVRLLWPSTTQDAPWLTGTIQWQAGHRMGIQLTLPPDLAAQHQQQLAQTLKTEGYWLTRHTLTDLRAYVQQHLPAYMVPSRFILVDHLPLTPEGELDRAALNHLDVTSPLYYPGSPISI